MVAVSLLVSSAAFASAMTRNTSKTADGTSVDGPVTADANNSTTQTDNTTADTGWTAPRADGGRTGATDDSGPTPYPQSAWNRATTINEVTIAVGNETVFTVVDDDSNRLAALNSSTGEQRWTRPNNTEQNPEYRITSGPFVAGETVYVGTTADLYSTEPNTILAYNATTGALRWDQNVTTGALAFDGEYLYGSSVAVNTTTGEVVWNTSLSGRAVAVADGQLYVVQRPGYDDVEEKRLVAVNATNGTVLWNRSVSRNVNLDRFVATADGLYATGPQFGPDSAKLLAYDPTDGSLSWSKTFDSQFDAFQDQPPDSTSALAVDNGTVYVTVYDKLTIGLYGPLERSTIYAIDAESSESRWQYRKDVHLSGPSVTNGSVYLAAKDPTGPKENILSHSSRMGLFSLDTTDGTEWWNYTHTREGVALYDASEPPMVANGHVYATVNAYIGISGGDVLFAFNATDQPIQPAHQFQSSNTAPYPRVNVSPADYGPNETVTLNASESVDVDGQVVAYEWDVDDDRTYERTGMEINVTTPKSSSTSRYIRLRVIDDDNASSDEHSDPVLPGVTLQPTSDSCE
ncbi:outer membrane protein assembly factor BamB family protein [Halorussus salinisoli]|uniref:outer membrane protein assembly factor BamB family protein n=1 Tax=Halorussus salinisoli TaxID=2558242 RepID=UPI001485C10B|nr:PQQ-binding-like beta-propeller repeat protein [Halorussus salinisoli]